MWKKSLTNITVNAMRELVNNLPETVGFRCVHIEELADDEIASFSTKYETGYGLVYYLKHNAMQDEKSNKARTYIVLDKVTGEIVSYFTLRAGFVSFEDESFLFKTCFSTTPGIELAYFAINSNYLQSNPLVAKKIGVFVFKKFIIPIAKIAADLIGAQILYIFALDYPRLIETYRNKYKFVRLNSIQEKKIHRRIRPWTDSGCIFMYHKL